MDRAFDLSTQVRAQLRVLWSLLGVVQIANGVIHLAGGEHLVLGTITLCFGLFVLPGSFLFNRMNRFVITFTEDAILLVRGLFSTNRIDWDSVSEINLHPISADFITRDGKVRTLNLGELGFADVQIVKPQIYEIIRNKSEAKGISLEDRSA